MRYEMEELVAVVGRLAEKYTAHESSSVTYEKAEQLMGAVLYCIQELEQPGQHSAVSAEGMTAQRAYELGRARVEEKTRQALALYHEILDRFFFYENRCLYDTFVVGLPEFFRRYDVRFDPRNTVLTLDYPVLRDLSGYEGVDRIYEFIRCVGLEQKFLRLFPQEYVIGVLKKYDGRYREMIENLCEIVLMSMAGYLLAGKPLAGTELEEADRLRVREVLVKTELNEIKARLKAMIGVLAEKCGEDGGELAAYLAGAAESVVVRLKSAAEGSAAPAGNDA